MQDFLTTLGILVATAVRPGGRGVMLTLIAFGIIIVMAPSIIRAARNMFDPNHPDYWRN